jgi:hypothetical protein
MGHDRNRCTSRAGQPYTGVSHATYLQLQRTSVVQSSLVTNLLEAPSTEMVLEDLEAQRRAEQQRPRLLKFVSARVAD